MSNLVYAGAGHVFPETVRRLNMLRPTRWYYVGETGSAITTSWDNADYCKDWLVYNLKLNYPGLTDTDTMSFGAFTTAPDGTTDTARLLRETTSTSEHSIIAGTSTGNIYYGKMRLASVLKYAGRRIVLSMVMGFGPGTSAQPYGCKAVFDLQNGVVAVDTTYFAGSGGTAWTIYPAQIQPVGNGWYLCYIEAQPVATGLGGMLSLFGKVSLDNGVGAGSESSTYPGNSASGVYAWRSNLLPSRAWDINNTEYFDDFDDVTMANIDRFNTKAPGYDWYVSTPIPAYEGHWSAHQPPDPACFSVADSVLTISGGSGVRTLGSFASLWEPPDEEFDVEPDRNYSEAYVGTGWAVPALFEIRTRYDTAYTPVDGLAFWSSGLEQLVQGRYLPTTDVISQEGDFLEIYASQQLPGWHTHYIVSPAGPGVSHELSYCFSTYANMSIWKSIVQYPPGNHVERLGVKYTSSGYTTIGSPPETTPLEWGPYVNPTASVLPPVIDYNEFNTYSTLWFPWTEDEPGQMVCFLNGGFCNFPLVYGPDYPENHGSTSNTAHLSDGQHQALFFGSATVGLAMHTDWIRVVK